MAIRKIAKIFTESESNPWNKRGLIRTHIGGFLCVYRALDLFCILACLAIVLEFHQLSIPPVMRTEGLLAIVLFLYTAESLELYCSWRTMKTMEMICTLWLACLLAATGQLITTTVFNIERVDATISASWLALVLASLTCWRLVYRASLSWIRRRGYNSRSAVFIGLTDGGLNLAASIADNPQLGIRNAGFFDDRDIERIAPEFRHRVVGKIEDAIQLAQKDAIDIIYITIPMSAQSRITDILNRCGDSTAPVHLALDFFEHNMLHTCFHTVGTVTTLGVYESPLYGARTWLKRAEDILLASIILVIVAIPMGIIAIAVKATSPGPIIYKQNRYGLSGRRIQVWKFRSMSTVEGDHQVRQATKNDVRVTPLGRFLRRTSLDELPQFFNVLQGSMSVVGPRPHAVCHNEEYRALIDCYMLRHKVKPGITGLAQINGFRGETQTIDKMKQRVDCDLEYIRSWSVLLDIKIVVLTLFTGFTGENTF